MKENSCPNCRTPERQFKENGGRGHRVDNLFYCSRSCATGATLGIRKHGVIDATKGLKRKRIADSRLAATSRSL